MHLKQITHNMNPNKRVIFGILRFPKESKKKTLGKAVSKPDN